MRVTTRLSSMTILLMLILLVAAVARIGWPGIAEFKYDEAMISRRAIDLAQHGVWPASTISSIPGIPQPPIKAFLLAIPYAFTRNPLVAVAFQGALGAITVALAYWLGRRYFNARAGVIAAALIAFAPWALFYDRKLWSQNVPLFTMLMMIGLYRCVADRSARWVVLSFAAVGLLIGFYLGNAILLGVVLLGLIAFPRWLVGRSEEGIRWQQVAWLAAGLIALVFTLTPYAAELTNRHAGPSAVGQAVSQNTPRPFDLLGQARMSALVATGYEFHALAGDKVADFYASLPLPDLNQPVDGVAVWLIVAAMAYVTLRAIVEALRGCGNAADDSLGRSSVISYSLLALWLLVPIGAWTAFRQVPYPHRYIMAVPSQTLAAGVMISDLWGWLETRWPGYRVVVSIVVSLWIGLLTVWHGTLYLGMLNFVTMTPINGGHGIPVAQLWAAASEARALSGADRLPLVIHTHGDDPEYQGGAAEFDAVLGDLPIYLVGKEGLEVYPTRDYVWIEDRGNGQYRIKQRAGTPTSVEPGLARHANGIDLLSVEPSRIYSAITPGADTTFVLTWRVWSIPPSELDYGYTVQLYNGTGKTLGQSDAAFLRTSFWRAGDTITTTVLFRIASDLPSRPPYRMVVAMYAYVGERQTAPVDILDIAGNPAGQQIIVPLPK